jgi:hypothetical protein
MWQDLLKWCNQKVQLRKQLLEKLHRQPSIQVPAECTTALDLTNVQSTLQSAMNLLVSIQKDYCGKSKWAGGLARL